MQIESWCFDQEVLFTLIISCIAWLSWWGLVASCSGNFVLNAQSGRGYKVCGYKSIYTKTCNVGYHVPKYEKYTSVECRINAPHVHVMVWNGKVEGHWRTKTDWNTPGDYHGFNFFD